MKLTKEQIVLIVVSILVFIGSFGIVFLIKDKVRPNNHDEQRFGTVDIHLAEGWSTGQQRVFSNSLPELGRLGPTFQLKESQNSVEVRVGSLQPCSTHGAGQYLPDQRVVVIDPTCAHGETELQRTFMHEIGHSIGLRHIPRDVSDNSPSMSPIGYGISLMNPNMSYPNDEMANIEVSDLDIREFLSTRHQ